MATCPVCGETKMSGWAQCPACGHSYEDADPFRGWDEGDEEGGEDREWEDEGAEEDGSDAEGRARDGDGARAEETAGGHDDAG